MFYMLRLMATLDPADLRDLMDQTSTADGVYMPRIQYAADVIRNRTLPATAPGDLDETGQVQDARNFLATNWRGPYLTLPYDITGTLPTPNPAAPRATESDFQGVASRLGVDVAAVHAVTDVESGGPFGPDGRPILRYELHMFYKHVKNADSKTRAEAYKRTHPYLCQPEWQDGEAFHHGGQANEWSLMCGAMILRTGVEMALSSASWGAFQIMGENYSMTGASSLLAFVSDEFASEAKQLKHFEGYIRSSGLTNALRAHDWAAFANGYNGAGYARNHYDTNMAAAYARRTGGS